MPRFRRLADGQVREKSSRFDVVTDADEAAEWAISVALKTAYPAGLVVGEEAAAQDGALIGRIATADLAFILDPIDGTKNFVAGLPLFGVMVAAAVRDAIVGTNFLPEPLRSTVNGNLSRVGVSSWLRCAAHEYRMAAAGHCHLLFYNKLMPWDHAAGWLLHREAGGYGAHFDGSAYRPDRKSGG